MKKIIGRFLSWLYRIILKVVQAGYRVPGRVRKVNARVISVGNITWGGTGKTPLTAKLARDLTFYGKRVAVLIRGYGNDESEELKKKIPNVPVLVGRDRVRTAREAVKKYGAEVLILDDGFQHLRLHRDFDIVNINATFPFGPGGLLPSGTLREPLENLSRANAFVLSKSNIGSKNVHWIRQKILAIKPNALIFEAVHKPMRFVDALKNRSVTLGEMRGKKVATICGIADPYSFEKTVENIGAEIIFAARYDDHHRYTAKELATFIQQAKSIGARDIITTEKDWVRLAPLLKNDGPQNFGEHNLLLLEIEFQVSDEEDFIRRCVNP